MKTNLNILLALFVALFFCQVGFAQISFTSATLQNADCFGQNATVRIVASGGTPPYEISFAGQTQFTSGSAVFTGVGPVGSAFNFNNFFNVSIVDNNFLSTFGTVFVGIDEVTALGLNIITFNVCDCSSPFDLAPSVSNGTPPYFIVTATDTIQSPIDPCTSPYFGNFIDSNNCPIYTASMAGAPGNLVGIDFNFQSDSVVDSQTALCPPFTWIDGNTYTSNNNSATFLATNSFGCDSVVTLNLVFQDSFPDVQVACDSFTWVDGNTYTQSNNSATFTFTGIGPNNCDSTLMLDLTILQSDTVIQSINSCGPYTWIDGNTYSTSNNTARFVQTGVAANGCDRIFLLDLTILNPSVGVDSIVACDSYTWIDGNTYTSNNQTATFILAGANSVGCDSTVNLNLTILTSSSSTDSIFSCGPFTWIDGNTYSTSNQAATFTIVGGAASGCDSTVTLNLTIPDSVSGEDSVFSCGPFTWIDGNTYSTSNQAATFTIVGGAASGCDSIVLLNLTIPDSVVAVDEIVACDSFTWVDGQTYFSSNQSASFTYPGGASNGCDSIVSLNLTIDTLNKNITSTVDKEIFSEELQASYQWLNCNNGFQAIPGETGRSFLVLETGSYAVQLSSGSCLDTSDCLFVIITNVEKIADNQAMKVYPNPSLDKVWVEFDQNQQGSSLRLFSPVGKLLAVQKIGQESVIEFDLPEPKGFYFLELIQENGQRSVVKLIKS